MPQPQVCLRRAHDQDAESAAQVWLRSFAAALPSVRLVHTDDQVRAWIRNVVIPERETWLATVNKATVVGLMALHDHDIDQLYLDPLWRGQGIGDLFIHKAKSRRPDGLALWTFQVNRAARRFYERRGFTEILRTDGSRNEESEPDIRMEWRPGK